MIVKEREDSNGGGIAVVTDKRILTVSNETSPDIGGGAFMIDGQTVWIYNVYRPQDVKFEVIKRWILKKIQWTYGSSSNPLLIIAGDFNVNPSH